MRHPGPCSQGKKLVDARCTAERVVQLYLTLPLNVDVEPSNRVQGGVDVRRQPGDGAGESDKGEREDLDISQLQKSAYSTQKRNDLFKEHATKEIRAKKGLCLG